MSVLSRNIIEILLVCFVSGNLWDCSDDGLDWLAMEQENGTIKRRITDYYDLVCHQRLYRGKPLHIVMDIIQVSLIRREQY